MKNLIFINGTMGAGKSAVSRELKKILAPSFFLDGDWCWDMEPFAPGAAEHALVLSNIAFLLNSYLAFDGRGNVIFCWVMHKRAVVEDLMARLDLSGARFFLFTLDVSEAELTRRLSRDVERGLRDGGVVERSLARRREFDAFGEFVPADGISPAEAARAIASAGRDFMKGEHTYGVAGKDFRRAYEARALRYFEDAERGFRRGAEFAL